MKYRCQNCSLTFDSTDEFEPLSMGCLTALEPGDTVPYGQCRECRCAVLEDFQPDKWRIVWRYRAKTNFYKSQEMFEQWWGKHVASYRPCKIGQRDYNAMKASHRMEGQWFQIRSYP